MKETIEHHAVLYALLVKHACAVLGEREGRSVMGRATYAYGVQRGDRMAVHAEAHHDPKDMNSYFIYGEWKGEPGENISSMRYTDSASISTVTKCAWYDAWKKHGLLKEGTLYCHYVDDGLAKGFDGSFALNVEKAIGKGDDCCIFHWNEAADPDYVAKRKEADAGKWILPFSFHCEELLDSVEMILRIEAKDSCDAIVQAALQEFHEIFPEEVSDEA